MKTLSIHCINQQKEDETIKTLMSASALTRNILVGDLHNSDKLRSFCGSNKFGYIKLSLNLDYSKAHNTLLQQANTEWHMHLYPGEEISDPEPIQEAMLEPGIYRLPCVKGEWLTKEVRLYHREIGCRFSNPVFESIEYDKAPFIESYIVGETEGPEKVKEIITEWTKEQPLSMEPKYYWAMACLGEKDKNLFVHAARNYLFADQMPSIANIMLRYYLACALAQKNQTRKEAAKHVTTCLANFVLMAEFWCLLGDMCMAEEGYKRALSFYDNAMLLGSRRRKDDPWPMHIPKYKKHPLEMIEKCKQAVSESKLIKVYKPPQDH